jgi:ABC-type transporter Mla subunit MlaD
MSNASTLVPPAVSALLEQRSPEIANAVTVTRAMQTHICELSNAYTNLQNACEDYAGFLDRAHHDAGRELQSLVTWTIGIESAGAVIGVLTAGIAEGAAQVAEGGRIALTAARVANIIRDLIAAAKGVCQTIRAALTRVTEISQKLKGLLGARLSRATTEAVSKLPNEAKSAEELAESRLTAAKPNNRGIDASELSQTRTVAAHLHEYMKNGHLARPYNASSIAMQEIMDSAAPGTDPGGVIGGLKWVVPGSLHGSLGVWELVVDPKTRTVLHFLFKEA